jgi:hypothetical protein
MIVIGEKFDASTVADRHPLRAGDGILLGAGAGAQS